MTSQSIDLSSPTWRAVEHFANDQVATLRQKNDAPALDAIATAELRGRIAAFKSLLALVATPDPELNADVGPTY